MFTAGMYTEAEEQRTIIMYEKNANFKVHRKSMFEIIL